MRLFQATVEDVPRIMECAREFCELLQQKLDETHYQSVWQAALSVGSGVIFLLEDEGNIVGGLGGIKFVEDLSGELYAVEKFWYLKPQFRGGSWAVRLLREFEVWAAIQHCHEVCMVHMERSMPEDLRAFYSRAGFVPFETFYRKRLCQS